MLTSTLLVFAMFSATDAPRLCDAPHTHLATVATPGAPKAIARRPKTEERAFVRATRAHVRKLPKKSAPIVVTLPIATEVARLRSLRGYSKVRLATGEKGYIRTSDLVPGRPTLKQTLDAFAAAKEGSRTRRTHIERATALAPGDLDVIDKLQAELQARGDKKWMYYGRKGWIAAKRRTFMWDGPLYPIVDGLAAIPVPCNDRATANGTRTPKAIQTKELRARAFPLVSSGKVVSVTARKNITQALRAPLCVDGHLAYRLPKRSATAQRPRGEGALVASWLVAGHTVVPFRQQKRAKDPTDVFTVGAFSVALSKKADGKSTWSLDEVTLDGVVSSAEQPLPLADAVPVALFYDETTTLRVLFWSGGPPSDDAACAAAGPSAFIVRLMPPAGSTFDSAAALAKARTQIETGRVWTSAAPSGCTVPLFVPLDGEPRDISHEKLESADWKQ